jgi:glucosamine-6-phosphate isomerase
MEINISDSYESMSAFAVGEIINTITGKSSSLLCLATGSTPLLTYQLFTKRIAEEQIDISKTKFIALDEWVGIPPSDSGSCQFFLNEYVFKPLQISKDQIHFFDGLAADLDKECKTMDAIIKQWGEIDLMIVGVGMNGHMGFNEPNTNENLYCHAIELDDITKRVGQKYFADAPTLTKGITLGMRHVKEARKVMMLANGVSKAKIISAAMNGEISMHIPASMMRGLNNGLLVLDKEAASLLQ